MQKIVKDKRILWFLTIVMTSISVLSLSLSASAADFQRSEHTFQYVLNGDGIEITGYEGPGGVVKIPDEIEGQQVTSIGRSAFASKQLSEVSLPTGLKSIGDYAFQFNQLTEVEFPEGLSSIDYDAFRYNKLTKIAIPEGITQISGGAFAFNQLTEVDLPAGITSIGTEAFVFNNLTKMNFPESLIEIGQGAFFRNQLSEIFLTKNIKKIGAHAFEGNNLSEVTITPNVTYIGVDAFKSNAVSDNEFIIFGVAGSRAESYANTFNHTFKSIGEIIEETTTEEIPYTTEEVFDAELDQGVTVIDQVGEVGQKVITYEVTYINGEEVNREIKSEEVTKSPVNEIVRIGTKVTEVKEETSTEEIPFTTEEVFDAELDQGVTVIDQVGEVGQKVIKYEVTYINGEEVNRE
ncbi:leucine-rich repeat protein, partial [Neobacillus sp. NPDC097160]|uniref:leucine-rich repeat protein n=1 Tax=Neobacillus sp. NPDC097160 TaxID=3364298 RepID=UPI003824B46B